MTEGQQIAIDGPAGSGKSSVAAALAERLGWVHVDSGALYRALTWVALADGIEIDDGPSLGNRLASLRLEFRDGRVHVDGEDRSREIRSPEVTQHVSTVAAHGPVRAGMLELQRALCEAARPGAVMEGRDIGSVVLPLAQCKIYLDADPVERARRRLEQMGEAADAERSSDMVEALLERDRQDMQREHSPLLISPDAHVLDTTSMSLEQVVDRCAQLADESVHTPLHPKDWAPHRYSDLLYRFCRSALARPVLRLLFGLRTHGTENERFAGGVIYACNHVSNFDPPVVACAIRREVWFMAKRELFFWPLGPLIKRLHAIPMHRRRYDAGAFEAAQATIQKGRAVLIFPEGTRRRPGQPGPIKRGLGILAMRTGRPYLPLLVRGSAAPGRALLRRPPMELWIGPPTHLRALERLSRDLDEATIQARIGQLYLAQLRALYARAERLGR